MCMCACVCVCLCVRLFCDYVFRCFWLSSLSLCGFSFNCSWFVSSSSFLVFLFFFRHFVVFLSLVRCLHPCLLRSRFCRRSVVFCLFFGCISFLLVVASCGFSSSLCRAFVLFSSSYPPLFAVCSSSVVVSLLCFFRFSVRAHIVNETHAKKHTQHIIT